MEIREEQIGLGEMLRDYAGMLLRHKGWILVSVMLGSGIAFAAFRYLPKVYESTTLILVEDQKVPQRYVQSASVEDVESRLSTMQQQIMSRSLLKKTIEKLGLYKKELEKNGLEAVIDRMRSNITLTTIGVGGRRNIDAFSLSFRGEEPQVVMKVTNLLASQFIEENLKVREQLVEGTSEFLESELKQLKGVLEEQERKIGEYKRLHMGELPQQNEANLRALDRYESHLQTLRFSRRSLEDRLALLEQTLKVATAQPDLPAMEGGGLPSPPLPPNPLTQKLIERKNLLTQLQGEYKDTYPDIVSLKLEIANLEKELAEAQAALQSPTAASGETPPAPTISPPDSPLLVDTRRQIFEAQASLRNLNEQELDIQKQIARFESRVENTPMREQEMLVLLRDYENIKASYESLLSKRLSAKLSENLEKKQKGEQFRILDSANLPEKPIQPDPIRFAVGGPLIGLALGVGLAFLREQLHVLIRKPEAVERVMALPVLATIPDFGQEKELAAKKVRQERVFSLRGERG